MRCGLGSSRSSSTSGGCEVFENERKARAVALETAAVALGDRFDDREAQSGAGAVEALEDPLGLGRARPFVGDADERVFAVAADGDRHPALAVLVRVADEVADGALERGALALHPRVVLDDRVFGQVR